MGLGIKLSMKVFSVLFLLLYIVNKTPTLERVFTPLHIAKKMIMLRKNRGKTLDPAAGRSTFFNSIDGCVGVEIDAEVCPKKCINMDFFNFPIDQKFHTIIGNLPSISYKYIPENTKKKLKGFDKRTNLFVFFIDKCLNHLENKGEMILITPREFLKSSSCLSLNDKLYNTGTITDIFDLDVKGNTPLIMWRFEKGNFSRKTMVENEIKNFNLIKGQLLFLTKKYEVPFSDLFFVKVGAISGLDQVFMSSRGEEFVYSKTRQTGRTRRMIFSDTPDEKLQKHKKKLLNRKIKKFTEKNWWMWGRNHYISDKPRIYINCKTKMKNPFFVHPCNNYDGSVLAIFLKVQEDPKQIAKMLNHIDWEELGFMCNKRYIFTQNSLESILLPTDFSYLSDIAHSHYKTSSLVDPIQTEQRTLFSLFGTSQMAHNV